MFGIQPWRSFHFSAELGASKSKRSVDFLPGSVGTSRGVDGIIFHRPHSLITKHPWICTHVNNAEYINTNKKKRKEIWKESTMRCIAVLK